MFIDYPSPNFDSRENISPTILVLHYTGMVSGAAALERLCDPASKVSSHYVVEEDGRIFRLVDEEMRAWHAGVSYWRRRETLNAHSIGIEIVNPGHEIGYRPFPKSQMKAVLDLCEDILSRHAIVPRDVVGHSDIAPLRKVDPGELFDWDWLAEHGIGVKPPKSKVHQGALLQLGDSGEDVFSLQNDLANYGYKMPLTGSFDGETAAVVRAFQRHFRPHDVSGVADAHTRDILQQLLTL